MLQKLRLIYIPFLIILVSFAGLYTFLAWLLNITSIWTALILSWIAIFMWIRPKIQLLKMKTKGIRELYHERMLLTLQFVATGIVFLTTLVAQDFVDTITARLTPLESISSINLHKEAKFYTLKNYFISKENAVSYMASKKNGKTSTLYLCIAAPIYASIEEVSKKGSTAWLGFCYETEIKDGLSEEAMRSKFDDFLERVDFYSRDVQKFSYLSKIQNGYFLGVLQEAIKKSPQYDPTLHHVFLMPIDTPFEKRGIPKFSFLLITIGIGTLGFLLLLMLPSLVIPKLE